MKKALLILFSLFLMPLSAEEFRLFNRLELVLPQAEQGDRDAQFNVGVIYNLGWNTEIDNQKAIYWFEKAAAQGHRSSIYNSGVHYSEGKGVKVDFVKAASYFERAAKMGHINAMIGLADLYKFGEIERNDEKMLYWFQQAGEKGHIYAQESLAEYFLNNANSTEAIYWLEKLLKQKPDEVNELMLAEQYSKTNQFEKAQAIYSKYSETNNPASQALLGSYMIRQGKYDQAVNFYQKSANQGDSDAQYFLGKMYFDGLNVKQDFQKSFEFFLKSAKQGHTIAQLDVARAYLRGKGTNKDHKQAVKWLTEAEKTGNSDAQFMLGSAMLDGRGIQKNIKQGVQLLIKSAQQGNRDGQYNLALYYKKQKQFDRAIYWFEKSALQGDQIAFSQLTHLYPKTNRFEKISTLVVKAAPEIERSFAIMLKAGKFGKKAQKQWQKHFVSAAERGSVDAQVELGIAYINNDGFEQDLAKARYWFEQAMNNNAVIAPYYLGVFNLSGLGGEQNLERAAYFFEKSEQFFEGEAGIYLAYLAGMGIKVPEKYHHFNFEPWAKNGNQLAQVLLARELHLKGEDKQAFVWFQKAAEQGNSIAQVALAAYYLDGMVVKKDLKEAIKWLSLSVGQNNSLAQNILGKLYLEGYGVPKDKQKAYQLFELAVQQGETESALLLAEKYREQNNREKMLELLNQAAKNDELPQAKILLTFEHLFHKEWFQAANLLSKLSIQEQRTILFLHQRINQAQQELDSYR